ncbi:histidine phosphatase family protein [Paenibacillus sp. MBLB4367]|uniref:histidine phosphatase family protein n=1 Tax=Paenibacillus sp. MBLB4367 TaxID=3384767 RepID=UPI003908133F
MTSKQLYLVRHCKAEGQEPGAKLTAEGLRQAQELAAFFAEIRVGAVIASPFTRAVQTAEPLCLQRELVCERDDRLQERVLSTADYPDWMEKLKQTYLDPDLAFEGGESSRDAAERGAGAIKDALAREEGDIVLVTHGALLSLMINRFNPGFGFEEWKRLSNPDVYRLTFGGGTCDVRRLWAQP